MTTEALPTSVQYWKTEAISRGRILQKMRDRLILINDEIENEGDRAYFGSTNDADEFSEIAIELDDYSWAQILAEKGERDYFAELRAANIAKGDLADELARLIHAYVNLLEIGRDRIVSAGGQCDPVDVMEAGDPNLRSAKAALAKARGA